MTDHTHSIYGNASHTHTFSGMPVYTSTLVPPGKMYGMGGAIYGRPEDMDRLLHQQFINDIIKTDATFTDTPRKPMSTIDKIKAERREKREREELEAKFEAWDAAIGSAADGDIYGFAYTPGDKTYRYAVIYTDKRWFLTGAETCGLATEDFIAWLINKDIDIQDLLFYEPLT